MEEDKKMAEIEKTPKNKHKLKSLKIKEKGGKIAADFKKFAFKGNIIDLAIAVIIGGAFGKIITSLVGDIIMPCLGALIGDVDFSKLQVVIKKADEAKGTAEIAFRYGAFLQTIIEFFIIALSIFIVYKVIVAIKTASEKKRAKHDAGVDVAAAEKTDVDADVAAAEKTDAKAVKETEQAVEPKELTKTELLLTEIRDALKQDKDKDNDRDKK